MNPHYIISVLHGIYEIPQDIDEVIKIVEAIEREPELYLSNGAGCRGYEQLKAIAEGGFL